MRFIFSIISFAAVCYGGYYFWNNHPEVRAAASEFVSRSVKTSEVQTLEVRYSADQIINKYKETLLKNKKYTFLEPQLKFHPYLMMEVKFSKNNQETSEGLMLWSLVNGEMVLNTITWEMTHGYEDCLNAKVSKAEFTILNLIARSGGVLDKKTLLSNMKSSNGSIQSLIASCKRKKLIVETEQTFRLHFENPRLTQQPQTNVEHWLVTKTTKQETTVPKKYSAAQIKSLAENAFGHDFAIRKVTEVFLPVYTIGIQNPDGSIYSTYFNAVSGSRIHSNYAFDTEDAQNGLVDNIKSLLN
jgi:hypothetical protein